MFIALIAVTYTVTTALLVIYFTTQKRQSARQIAELKYALLESTLAVKDLQDDNEINRWLLRCRNEDVARLTRENRDHIVSLSLVLTEMDRSA